MTPGMLRQALSILLPKKLMMLAKQPMVNFQMYFLAFILRSTWFQVLFLLLDANLGSGPIPDAPDDQETGQGTHQATGEEEHENTPNPQSADGIIKISLSPV